LIEAVGKLRGIAAMKSDIALGARSRVLNGRKLPPRFRNRKNRKETWGGRGHRPRWLVAALKGGKKLEAFAVK
jgi:DNA-binding protein H-NS